MSEWIGKKGTTGPSVVYQREDEGVFVYAKGECVYHIPDHDVPDEVLDSNDTDDLFNWVFENYSSEIDECMEALGI